MKIPRACLFSIVLAIALAGCEDSSDHDHKVPAGKGSLIVDNNTSDDIAVYIGGTRANNADAYETKSFDLDPGVYRVVLDQRNGDRSFRDDVDILEGKRTVLDMAVEVFDDEYDVVIFFD